MRNVVATLKVRNADTLSELHALQMARLIASRQSDRVTRGKAEATLDITGPVDDQVLKDWLEQQGAQLVNDRHTYDDVFTAKLYE